MTKQRLFELGKLHITKWCAGNMDYVTDKPVVVPDIIEVDTVGFGTCAYYRNSEITISVRECAGCGMAGMAWSWPGYVVDRTPYGVLAHELAHHVDRAHGPTGGLIGSQWRRITAEAPITTYAPNDNEWFAEIFRLFVTNPDLLSILRPRVFALLIQRWPCTIEKRKWSEVLEGAPRQLKAAQNKINKAKR